MRKLFGKWEVFIVKSYGSWGFGIDLGVRSDELAFQHL